MGCICGWVMGRCPLDSKAVRLFKEKTLRASPHVILLLNTSKHNVCLTSPKLQVHFSGQHLSMPLNHIPFVLSLNRPADVVAGEPSTWAPAAAPAAAPPMAPAAAKPKEQLAFLGRWSGKCRECPTNSSRPMALQHITTLHYDKAHGILHVPTPGPSWVVKASRERFHHLQESPSRPPGPPGQTAKALPRAPPPHLAAAPIAPTTSVPPSAAGEKR